MSCTSVVLELRLEQYLGEDGSSRIVRIYFTEPEHESDMLLLLYLVWKSPGPIGLDEQTQHARTAQFRADQHGF
ncbi:hypothetical protein ACFQU3_10685 [Terrabacter sp. GCM10028922]|uniref:hypothetical protein n=1 Tax=Terrabacter sp. GCM10028922 TaxID=3273428 RepID=UPI0036100B06